MSKTRQDSKDDSDVIDAVTKKYFSEIEHSVPHMQQVLFDFQNECYKTWKNAINANIALHKEFLHKSGLDYAVSDSMKSLVDTASEEAAKYGTYCKNIAIANIESAKQNAKTLDTNAELFADMNRRMMRYWLSAAFPKRD